MSKKAFDRIKEGALEALSFAKGEADARKFRVHIPDEIDTKAMRKRMHLTQEQFCQRYGFGLARVKDWEQGRSQPDEAMRAYLKIILNKPNVVKKILESA